MAALEPLGGGGSGRILNDPPPSALHKVNAKILRSVSLATSCEAVRRQIWTAVARCEPKNYGTLCVRESQSALSRIPDDRPGSAGTDPNHAEVPATRPARTAAARTAAACLSASLCSVWCIDRS